MAPRFGDTALYDVVTFVLLVHHRELMAGSSQILRRSTTPIAARMPTEVTGQGRVSGIQGRSAFKGFGAFKALEAFKSLVFSVERRTSVTLDT